MNWKNLLTNVGNVFKKKEPLPPTPKEEFDETVEKIFEKAEKQGIVAKTWKYSEDQKLQAIKLIGQGWTTTEIMKEMKESHKIEMTRAIINAYRHNEKWKPVIKKIRDEYTSSISDVAGSHKRVRLERAERTYDRAVAKGDIKNQIVSIEQQRKEFDKHESNQFILLQQQYNYMSDEEVEERKKMLMDKLKGMKKELTNGTSGVQGEVRE